MGEFSQEVSTAYKHIKKHCHIQSGAAKLAFKLDGMEEAKRDDFLRSFNGLCKELNIHMPRDLMDAAEGTPIESIVPVSESQKPGLVVVGNDEELAPAEEWAGSLNWTSHSVPNHRTATRGGGKGRV